MDQSNRDSGVWLDTWTEIDAVVNTMNAEESLLAMRYFTAAMATKQELRVLRTNDDMYSMRDAIRYVADHHSSVRA